MSYRRTRNLIRGSLALAALACLPWSIVMAEQSIDATTSALSLMSSGGTRLPTPDGFGAQFAARLEYRTLDLRGLHLEIGSTDPLAVDAVLAPALQGLSLSHLAAGGLAGAALPGQVPGLSGLAAGISYGSRLAGAEFRLGVHGAWQDPAANCSAFEFDPACNDGAEQNYRLFGQVGLGGAALTAYYFAGDTAGARAGEVSRRGTGVYGRPDSAIRDGFGIQGTYAFGNERTLVGIGYSQSSMNTHDLQALVNDSAHDSEKLGRDMWTVGVYHDVNSWFRFVAQYSHMVARGNNLQPAGSLPADPGPAGSSFSVGGFIFW